MKHTSNDNLTRPINEERERPALQAMLELDRLSKLKQYSLHVSMADAAGADDGEIRAAKLLVDLAMKEQLVILHNHLRIMANERDLRGKR